MSCCQVVCRPLYQNELRKRCQLNNPTASLLPPRSQHSSRHIHQHGLQLHNCEKKGEEITVKPWTDKVNLKCAGTNIYREERKEKIMSRPLTLNNKTQGSSMLTSETTTNTMHNSVKHEQHHTIMKHQTIYSNQNNVQRAPTFSQYSCSHEWKMKEGLVKEL